MTQPLSEKKQALLKNKFYEYCNNPTVNLKTIAVEIGCNSKIAGKYFRKFFGKEYEMVSKLKSSKHSERFSNSKMTDVFKRYAGGELLTDISKKLGTTSPVLHARLRRMFGNGYTVLARKMKYSSKYKKKVSDETIRAAFEIYASSNKPLITFANELSLAESSLISRFQLLFGEEYTKIAKARRDERKVTKQEYVGAFKQYATSDADLETISNRLGISIDSLRSRFVRLFGKQYSKIAQKKMQSNELNRKGELAEFKSMEYLKRIGMTVHDVRRKAILQGTLKRPDFVSGDMFIEVKHNFINLTDKRKKGYVEIVNDYLNKATKNGSVLKRGMIISLKGFSDAVINKANEDRIILVGPEEIDKVLSAS